MNSYENLQAIADRVNTLSQQLSSEKLSQKELEEFKSLSRDLYERALILDYKAKEEQVYANSSSKQTEEKAITDAPEPTEEIINEVEETAASPKNETKEEQETASAGEIQFDFSGEFDQQKSEEVVDRETTKISEAVATETKETSSVETPTNTAPETPPARAASSGDAQSFYAYFSKAYQQAAGDRLGTSKLDTLQNAVGLNDRLLFIGELFNGNTDLYNSILSTLDDLENNEAALRTLSEVAAKENWDKDNSAVDEFAHLIIRRYVE
ncbi:hypothetical protein CW751_01195 [Brumimicrobium salinarum]|uniref:Uncharacterized protein n=1 Tax=Brumimicrobium salinarum TaxID=2058658 RepID=A0A2I0R5W6_9FLAO|nr:hypothetical protein [Brumimicrobium salinarum]PKR81982.1 hypothetical protein CW751_01195 [Brumimicrobium salinarum]